MKVTIQFNTDNAAFRDIDGEVNPAAVLDQLKKEFEEIENHFIYGRPLKKIKDYNGNTIGTKTIER